MWLTYSNAMKDVRALWARASSPTTAKRYGLHGLRVAGFNGAKRGKHGKTLAVAQGGWDSLAHERYDRFDTSDVLQLPSIIAQQSDAEPTTAPVLQRAPLQPAMSAGAPPTPRAITRPVVASLSLCPLGEVSRSLHMCVCWVCARARSGSDVDLPLPTCVERGWSMSISVEKYCGWRVAVTPVSASCLEEQVLGKSPPQCSRVRGS